MSATTLVDGGAPGQVRLGLASIRLFLVAACFFLAFHDVFLSLDKE